MGPRKLLLLLLTCLAFAEAVLGQDAEIISYGQALKILPGYLGTFERIGIWNGRPMFKKKAKKNLGGIFLFYGTNLQLLNSDLTAWYVGSDPRHYPVPRLARFCHGNNDKSCTEPPVDQWYYKDQDDRWKSDDATLRLEHNGDVTILASGQAAKIQGGNLGVYLKVDRDHTGRPIYKQKATLGLNREDTYLFFDNNSSSWLVGTDQSDAAGAKFNRSCHWNGYKDCLLPPEYGWKYHQAESGTLPWKRDRSLELKFNYDASFCRKLKLVSENLFSLDFETYVNFYKTLGEYEIQTEFFSEGRPVYKRVDGKEATFLMVPEHSPQWKVITFSGANKKVFIVSGKGTLSPTDAGPWQHCLPAFQKGCLTSPFKVAQIRAICLDKY